MHLRQLITTENDGMGTLVGAKFATFLSEEFYMGGSASGGIFTSGEYLRTGMGYGGFSVGVEQEVERRVTVDAGVLFGLAAARPGSSLAIEPSLSIIQGFSGWQMAFNMSYLHMPELKSLSGVTLGLSFEKRIFNLDFLE